MKNKVLIILGLFFLFLFSPGGIKAADPHFSLSPQTGSFSENFDLEIKIDTGGQAAGAADIYLTFPADLLKIQKITKGNAFGELTSSINNTAGSLRASAYFSAQEAGKSFNGVGLVATVTFEILKSGTASLNFVCTQGATNDSNIIEKVTSKDIIVCNANINGSYTLGSSSGSDGSNPTPTPTSGSTSTTTPTPTPTTSQTPTTSNTPTPTPTIPVTGFGLPTFLGLGFGVLILLTGILFLV